MSKIFAQTNGTFKDRRDGKIYKTVKIGKQVWFAENLAFKVDSSCLAYNNDTSNVKKYGYFYDWETAKKVCPEGWHLPDYGEFNKLRAFYGDTKTAAEKLKDKNGFNAIPVGGFSIFTNKFYGFNDLAIFWTSWAMDASPYELEIYFEYKSYYGKNVPTRIHHDTSRESAKSVRCLKD